MASREPGPVGGALRRLRVARLVVPTGR